MFETPWYELLITQLRLTPVILKESLAAYKYNRTKHGAFRPGVQDIGFEISLVLALVIIDFKVETVHSMRIPHKPRRISQLIVLFMTVHAFLACGLELI